MLKKEKQSLSHVVFSVLLMKKQRKRNEIIGKIISSNILKSSKKKGKRNSPRFCTGPRQTSSRCNFFASQKFSEEWKENFRMSSKKFWEIMHLAETLYSEKQN